MRIFSPIGSRVPLYSSAVGKAMMFDWSDERIRRLAEDIVPLTEHTVRTAEELLACIRQMRARGYAVAVDQWQIGVSGVAAPLRDFSGQVVATLGITCPSSRTTETLLDELGLKVVTVARQISQSLGYRHRAPEPAAE